MIKKKYKIEIKGEDMTYFEMLLNTDEAELIQRISNESIDASEYEYMPILRIEEIV